LGLPGLGQSVLGQRMANQRLIFPEEQIVVQRRAVTVDLSAMKDEGLVTEKVARFNRLDRDLPRAQRCGRSAS
jgi:hypothetical protein